jgi:hypothetical protein
MKSAEKQNFNKIMVPSSVLNVCLKRSCHAMNVWQMPHDNDNTTEQNGTENFDFTSITNSAPVLEKKLKILFLEVEVQQQSGNMVLDNVKLGQWKELLEMETRSRRRKYLSYLFGVAKK